MAQNFTLPYYDGTIVKCSNNESCLHAVPVRKKLEIVGFTTTDYEINQCQPVLSLALLSIVKDSKFVLVFYCNHVKSSLEKILKQDLKSFRSKVIIVAKSTDRLRKLTDFTRFTVFESNKIIQHIQQIVDMTDQDRYPSIDQLHADPPSIPQRTKKPYTEQTNVKKLDTSPTLDKLEFSTNIVPSGFIHADTFDTSDTENRGTHVLRSSCIPKVSYVSSQNDIKQRFNGATEEDREDLSKQIMSSTIKELIRNGDFLGMINLLDIDDRRIQTSVFSAIDTYQLQTNLCTRCIRGTEMLKGVKHLFELCRKCSANQFAMVSLLPLTLDTTAVLYLASCVSGVSQSNLAPDIQIFTENSLSVVNKIISDYTLSSQCQYLLLSLRKLLHYLKRIGMNPSPLQMGNFRDALMNESSRDELKKKFAKSMTYLEQYSLLIVVINQIMLKSEIQIVAFLSDLSVILRDKISKKSIQTIFPQLLLITKGVVQRLCKDARKVFRWISYRELTTMVSDAVDAVGFLHNKAVIHRNVTTFAFSLRKNNVVLHDFSVSKVLGNNTGFISDLENTQIPVLWSAPESILEDHYDTKTDTWMIGQFIYEVFTHGCHPYTEVYGTPTEQLLEYIVFQDLKPQKWPCIPKDVHDIIIGCCMTNPEDRIDICRIGKLLNSILISLNGGRRNLVSHIFEEDKKYPELDLQHDVPERGLPSLFEQLKHNNTQDRDVIRKSYFNIRKSQRRILNVLQIKKADRKAPDQPIIQAKHNFIAVTEPVTVDFVQSLPHLDKQTCTEILQLLDTPSREERRNMPGNYQLILKYKLHKSTNLLELAFKHFCGDPDENGYEYLKIVQKIVKFIGEMHKRNWILRDLCADNIFVLDTNQEITMPRLGRMLWFDSNGVLDDCIIDEVKEDRRRWLPIEVLQNGQYSKEGDIYMFAMVIYELYMALDVHQHDNMASELECAPFATVSISELLKTLYSGEVPMQPDYCPDWLYDIMKLCWNRDRTRRPTTNYIIKEIKRNMETSTNQVSSDSDQEKYEVPEGSEPEGDYEHLKKTNSIDSENYDSLDSESYDSLDDISLDKFNPSVETTCHCPIISIPKYGNTNPFKVNRQQTCSFESRTSSFTKDNVQFSCVNSDTESDLSTFKHHNVQSKHRSASRRSFPSNCFKFADIITSEREYEYRNDYQYQYTDAKSKETSQTFKSISFHSNSISKAEASASSINGAAVVFKEKDKNINEGINQNCKEDQFNSNNASNASSFYCHMDLNTRKPETCKTSKQSTTPCDIRSIDFQGRETSSASSCSSNRFETPAKINGENTPYKSKTESGKTTNVYTADDDKFSDRSRESSTYCHMDNTADEDTESESYKDSESLSNLCSRSEDNYLAVVYADD